MQIKKTSILAASAAIAALGLLGSAPAMAQTGQEEKVNITSYSVSQGMGGHNNSSSANALNPSVDEAKKGIAVGYRIANLTQGELKNVNVSTRVNGTGRLSTLACTLDGATFGSGNALGTIPAGKTIECNATLSGLATGMVSVSSHVNATVGDSAAQTTDTAEFYVKVPEGVTATRTPGTPEPTSTAATKNPDKGTTTAEKGVVSGDGVPAFAVPTALIGGAAVVAGGSAIGALALLHNRRKDPDQD